MKKLLWNFRVKVGDLWRVGRARVLKGLGRGGERVSLVVHSVSQGSKNESKP